MTLVLATWEARGRIDFAPGHFTGLIPAARTLHGPCRSPQLQLNRPEPKAHYWHPRFRHDPGSETGFPCRFAQLGAAA